ncbi:9476_t:CDS:2, partial [Racocetra fulgida]
GDTDDFVAILYALKSKELDIRGVTYGVILGADYPLCNLNTPGCSYKDSAPEGQNGRRDSDLLLGINRQLRLSTRLWYDALKGFNITKEFADLIDTTIEQTGEKPILILTGTATNLALLLRAFPTYSAKIDKVFWMGGALEVPGNVFIEPNNTRAEFNVFFDCIAAQELLASDLDITLIPLDFTSQTPLNLAFFDKLAKLNSFYGKFVYKLLSIIRTTWLGGVSVFFDRYSLWDPKAIAVVKNIGVAKIVTNRSLAVTCNGNPNDDGQFVVSKTSTIANLKVAIDAIVSNPIEDSPFFQDFLEVFARD